MTLAPWLNKDLDDPSLNKNTIRGMLYYIQLHLATPPWADQKRIAAIYKERTKRRKAGADVVVDHKVPLNSFYVCGLQCEDNLEIITDMENAAKSNHWWPDMWNYQMELIVKPECEQYALPL